MEVGGRLTGLERLRRVGVERRPREAAVRVALRAVEAEVARGEREDVARRLRRRDDLQQRGEDVGRLPEDPQRGDVVRIAGERAERREQRAQPLARPRA